MNASQPAERRSPDLHTQPGKGFAAPIGGSVRAEEHAACY
jgi:hypothetical protein